MYMTFNNEYYLQISKILQQAIEVVVKNLTVDQKFEVEELMNAGEYGLAFETILNILSDKPESLSKAIIPLREFAHIVYGSIEGFRELQA